MFKHLILPWLLPIFGMFFAAGADALSGADAGAADAGVIGDGSDTGAEGDFGADVDVDVDTQSEKQPVQQKADQEEPEVSEFRVPVGRRMVGLVNKFPKLKEAFAAHPELQKELEPVFRREAAFREIFPTVAEARQLREELPNGIADLQALRAGVQEVEALDSDFYTRDLEGNYPGHQRIVENMFRDDREAAVSLFRSLPKQWAQLDRESYNDVMGKIVGATFAGANIPDFLGELIETAKEAKQDGLVKGLTQLYNWASGYMKEKPQPSEEEQRLGKERQNFQREKAEREKADGQTFHKSFVAESHKLQVATIRNHPAVQKLLANKTIPEAKKNDIIEQVRQKIEKLLGKSPSFMNKLTPAYSGRKLQDALDLQKAAWSQQWLLNRMVRTVFDKEIPSLVSQNKASVQRRAGAPQNVKVTGDQKATPTGPVKIGGRWYRDGGKGAPFTTAEVLAGKHEQ